MNHPGGVGSRGDGTRVALYFETPRLAQDDAADYDADEAAEAEDDATDPDERDDEGRTRTLDEQEPEKSSLK